MLFTGGAEDGSWFDAEWITLVPEVYRGDV
jgi:hypothetical protein